MNIIERLNKQIDKFKYDYLALKTENESLKRELNEFRNKNDELVRHNQDMLLKIDSTLTLKKR